MLKDEAAISKKPSLASKLSRAKRKAETILNRSEEDFLEDSNKKVEKKKVVLDKKCSTESSNLSLQSCDLLPKALPKCPLCGKTFSVGQELKRYNIFSAVFFI